MNYASVLLASIVMLYGGSITEIHGQMKPHETILKSVELEAGKSTIDITSSIKDGIISCRFSDASGIVGFEQPKTTHCFAQSSNSLSSHINLEITNDEERTSEYMVVIKHS